MRILSLLSAGLVAAAAVSTVSVGAASAVSSAPDPYSVKVTTHTTVTTPDPIHTDVRVDIQVKVTANSPTQPTGTVALSLSAAPHGGGQARSVAAGPGGWHRTIDYNGGTVHVTGPSFPKVGDWLVTARFTPGDDQFRGSHDGANFSVIAGQGHDNGHNDHDNGGLLPDTGGPALLWLLLGGCLLGGGATAVVMARRRAGEPVSA